MPRIPFGKYGPKHYPPRGADISFINSGYLKWLIKEEWFFMKYDALCAEIEAELRERDTWNSHFDQDKVA